LKAAAEMIGAYWARLESQHRLEAAVESLNTRLRYEEALAECSKHLLGEGEEALASALSQLVAATDADYMWLEENYEDPELGLCARLVHEIQSPRLDEYALEDPWLGGPHSETPTSYRALSRGEPSVILTSELSGSERALYESDGLLSELVLPVFTFGRWTGAIGFADYTVERQWVERDIQILRTASEMVGSYLERRQSRERLEALVRSKDEFIASVSHELRTPLTSVLGFAGVLLDAYEDMPDGERRDLMALIRHEAQEVAWIVDDLLVFARADIGTLAATAVDLSLHEQVTAVLSGQPDAHAARVALEGDDVRATADPGRVRQIVRNLVTNALKYGGPGVTVEVDAVDESAVVRVTDDGNGIPENEWESIFEPYYRAHDPGGQPGSVGLGLAVSRKLAMLMGGDLTYTHADGRSIFQLLLPLARTGIAASA
jgi:signal transduction histidine kinase